VGFLGFCSAKVYSLRQNLTHRFVWLVYGLENSKKRLNALEEKDANECIIFSGVSGRSFRDNYLLSIIPMSVSAVILALQLNSKTGAFERSI
jgi:hypothetical protein